MINCNGTGDFITGWKIKEELGIVAASAVKCRAVHYDLWVRIRSFFGGEIKSYGELLSSTSAESTRRLLLEAKHLNADAVVKLRYQISTTADPVNGAFCYSTVYVPLFPSFSSHLILFIIIIIYIIIIKTACFWFNGMKILIKFGLVLINSINK